MARRATCGWPPARSDAVWQRDDPHARPVERVWRGMEKVAAGCPEGREAHRPRDDGLLARIAQTGNRRQIAHEIRLADVLPYLTELVRWGFCESVGLLEGKAACDQAVGFLDEVTRWLHRSPRAPAGAPLRCLPGGAPLLLLPAGRLQRRARGHLHFHRGAALQPGDRRPPAVPRSGSLPASPDARHCPRRLRCCPGRLANLHPRPLWPGGDPLTWWCRGRAARAAGWCRRDARADLDRHAAAGERGADNQ